MAVNTAALKTFAPAMRRQLMEAVGRKLDLLLNSQTPDTLSTYAKQIAELRAEQEKSREQLLERVAYTWFNRLCALRYLDAKGWHPFGCKVLMPADGSETQPELLKLMRSGSLPADLKAFTNEQRLNQLLDGQIPTAIPGGDAQGEVYRELVLAACRSYHKLLPDLFEGLDDASELLLPDDLLTEGSIAGSFRSSISDSDCDDVEIIGWLYQFYISEKKDEVIGKVVKSEDIPAATQLFTPNWIVKYMVQNTIGAQWLATYPDSPLREQMEFYIEPAEQTDEVKAKLAEITPTSLNPEELTLMDPACGSGHILVEAYEIFKAIYLEQGYQLREVPKLVIEKNLFGIDIDKRAAQLTGFSLMMKGRGDDRRLFDRSIVLNVMTLQDSRNFDAETIVHQAEAITSTLHINGLYELKKVFDDATVLGSLIQVQGELKEILPDLKGISETSSDRLLLQQEQKKLKQLVKQADSLSKKYDAVVANPPYMGRKGMNASLKIAVDKNYIQANQNLSSAFMERFTSLCKRNGRIGVMAPNAWLFLSTYEPLRQELSQKSTVTSLVEPEYHSFFDSAYVSICAFSILNKQLAAYQAKFIDLQRFYGSDLQPIKTLEAIKSHSCNWLYTSSWLKFKTIPGMPFAYGISDAMLEIFARSSKLGDNVNAAVGLQTGNNEKFLRYWFEVDFEQIGFSMLDRTAAYQSGKKWFPYNKGGDFRRWWGNHAFVCNWSNDGREIRHYGAEKSGKPKSRAQNTDFYFKPSVSWSDITSGPPSFRKIPPGFIHDVKGMSAFSDDPSNLFEVLCYCNTPIISHASNILNPGVNFQIGNFKSLPYFKKVSKINSTQLCQISAELISISSGDWNAYERSWSFKGSLIINADSNKSRTLDAAFRQWRLSSQEAITKTQDLEEKNNIIFINAYGLSGEISSEVPLEEITLTVNPAYRYKGEGCEEEKLERFQRDSIAELLSYATGCIMGRYSLDCPSLILADSRSNQDEQIAAYEAKIGKPINEIQFKPDADAIIPVLDGEWFEDDIVARTREFLKVTFPESSVAENLRFIEDSIGKDIRKYFCKDFYKDHLQTYKKRPIYWMVQSPAGPSRGGFACLIYLHRYTPDTLLQVLNNYFRPYLQKLEARQQQLERDQNNDALPKREQTAARKEAEKITKVLKECQAWEKDALLPLAQQRIELDLDDGVKVNYLKLQEVLARIPGLAAKGD